MAKRNLQGEIDVAPPAAPARDAAGAPGGRHAGAVAEERKLVALARAGDPRALDSLATRLSAPAYRFGRAFCGDPHDAQDVMQDVLASFVRGIGSFRGESSLSTWAYTVARHACTRMRRRKVGAPAHLQSLSGDSLELGPLEIPDERADTAREAERRELRETLKAALLKLPVAQREVLVLRDVEGLPGAEVARILKLKERAVKSRLHRARLALRRLLHHGGAEPRLPARPTTPCPDTALLLSRHLEGDLDRNLCSSLEKHVAECRRCRDVCRSLKATLAVCRRWGGDRPPGPFRKAVRQALAESGDGLTRGAAADPAATREDMARRAPIRTKP